MSTPFPRLTLGEIVDPNRGVSYGIVQPGKFVSHGIPIIKVNNMTEGKIDRQKLDMVSPKVESKYLRTRLQGNEILISLVGTLGEVALVGRELEGCNVVRAIGVLPVEDKHDPEWVYWHLKSRQSQILIRVLATTSVQATLNLKELSTIPIFYLPKAERYRIVEILGALDDKIELNLEINKTLEAMAMALFKEWFVDFGPFRDGGMVDSELGPIPKGWEVKQFDSMFTLSKGLSYKSKFYSDDGFPMINLKCISRKGGFRRDGVKYYAGPYKEQHIVQEGDLLVAMTDLTQDRVILGSPIIAPKIEGHDLMIASLDLSILKQHSGNIDMRRYLYHTMRMRGFHEYILAYGNGSTVMHLDKVGLLKYQLLVPSDGALEKFNGLLDPIDKLYKKNNQENEFLSKARNTLLPKLISGEVRVKLSEEMEAA